MNDTSKIRIAIIGGGRAGLIHAHNFAHTIPGASLLAVVDPEESKMREAEALFGTKSYSTHHDLLNSNETPDAVVVVSPTKYHKDIVVDCARAGLHVLCEKPMAMTEAECMEMLIAADENKVKLQMGFMRRFDRSFRAAKEAVDTGEIGDVVLIKSLTRGPSIPQPWQYDIKASNGPLAEVNSHDIDTLRWFSKGEINEVYAIAGNYRCPEAATQFPDFYDNVIMTCRLDNGCQGHIDGAVSVKYGYDARVEIVGTEGVIFVGRTQEHDMLLVNTKNGIQTPFKKSWRTLFTEAYLEEDRAFIQCIQQESEPIVSGKDGLEAVKIVNAGNRSIIEKKPITISHNLEDHASSLDVR